MSNEGVRFTPNELIKKVDIQAHTEGRYSLVHEYQLPEQAIVFPDYIGTRDGAILGARTIQDANEKAVVTEISNPAITTVLKEREYVRSIDPDWLPDYDINHPGIRFSRWLRNHDNIIFQAAKELNRQREIRKWKMALRRVRAMQNTLLNVARQHYSPEEYKSFRGEWLQIRLQRARHRQAESLRQELKDLGFLPDEDSVQQDDSK